MQLVQAADSVFHLSPLAGRGRPPERSDGGRVRGLSNTIRANRKSPSPQPSQPKSDLSDFGQSSNDRTRVNPSSVASGEREQTEIAARLSILSLCRVL